MLSPKLAERVNRLLDVQFVERRQILEAEIEAAKSMHNARGMLRSGAYVKCIQEICIRELEVRGVLTWQALVRVINLLGEEDPRLNSPTDLKTYFQGRIHSSCDELSGNLSRNLFDIMPLESVPLTPARDHVIEKHNIEIDLFADTLETNRNARGARPPVTANYNFYGNVGSVQSGDGSTANVVQNLGAGEKEALVQALNLAKDALNAAVGIAPTKRAELVAVVQEATAELNGSTPNNTKLHTLLSVIGTTVQSLASAPGAYAALKTTLIPFGITLP